MFRKPHAWIAVLALVIATSGASATAAQALPPGFWGVVPQGVLKPEQLQRLQRGGVQSERIPISWPAVQPIQGGAFDWSSIDVQVEAAAQAGIAVLPFLSNAPTWAAPSVFVPGSGRTVSAPAHLPVSGAGRAGWISFLTAAIARYGPSGSFWAERPLVPRRPVRTWQIWNEPNFKYFVTKPDPAEYGKLVKISYTAIKTADPAAKVVLGGLFARPKGCRANTKPKRIFCAADFLEQMYERTPGIKTKFNGVALHPYTAAYQELPEVTEEFRAVLSANKDAAKSLWVTELGWSSQPLDPVHNIFAKGPAGQAAQLKGAFSLLKANQRKWKVQGVYWFSVDDYAGACNFCDGSGLFGTGFIPKKSWFSYVKFAGGTP